jgi:hypothetical protein
MNLRLSSAHHEMAGTASVAPHSNMSSQGFPPAARHEMQDYSQADRHAEAPRMAVPQVVSRKELQAHHRPIVQDPLQQGQGLRSMSPQELHAGSSAFQERIRE